MEYSVLDVTETNQRAARMLHRLLSAAAKAQSQGKYVALSRIIREANKLSTRLQRSIDKVGEAREQHVYTPVQGEIVN